MKRICLMMAALTASAAMAENNQNAFMIGGTWTMASTNADSKPLALKSKTSSDESSFTLGYQRHLGNDFWVGPYLAYALSRVTADSDESSASVWRPGVEVRKFFATNNGGYIAPYVRLGWAWGSEDAAVKASYSGVNFGGGVGFGQYLGQEGNYLVETFLDYSHASLSGEITQGATKEDLDVSSNRFAFGLVIGKRF